MTQQLNNIIEIAAELVMSGKCTADEAIFAALAKDDKNCRMMLDILAKEQDTRRITLEDLPARNALHIVKRNVYNGLRNK